MNVTSLTRSDAEAMVAEAETAYNAQDIDRILKFFHPDIVALYGCPPELRGLDGLRKFHEEKFAKQVGYRLKKTLRTVSGDTVGVEFYIEFMDRDTGQPRRCRGLEFWKIRDGQMVRWDVAINCWDRGTGG